MSTSGNMRNTRSRTAASVAPSAAGSNPGSDTSSVHAASQAGSRTSKTQASRSLDTYGSRDFDRAAAQQRRTSQNVGAALARAFDQDARAPNPNGQFQQGFATPGDTTSFLHQNIDGATIHHTPAPARQTPARAAYLIVVAKIWLTYLVLTMLSAACLVALSYYCFLFIRLDRFTRTSQEIAALGQGQESLRQQMVLGDEGLMERLENDNLRLNIIEEKLLNLGEQQEFSVFGGKQSVDWFDPRNMAVTIPKYTSPEKMRDVSGWLRFFKKQVPFSAAPKIVGPFANVEKMWCAPSDHGKAQVTVLLAKKIIPQILVVEQTDIQATTPYWQTFPNQIEFWARFDENAKEPIIRHVPSWVPGPHNDRKLADAQALPSSFKLLGRWYYEIHKNHRKQFFEMAVNQPTDLVSFRVNSNHGDADQICLHKLRLYGEPVEPGASPRIKFE